MAEKNKKGRAITDKAELLRAFVLVFCFTLFLLLAYAVGSLLYERGGEEGKEGIVKVIDPDESFKDCQLLESKCLDIGCNYYSRCGDGHYEACRVYDCGDKIGIYTEDADGKQNTERQAKPDKAAIAEKKRSCKGTMETLSDECVNGEEKIKVKISTEGECEIVRFAVIFNEAQTKSSTFKSLGGDIYEVTAASCGNVTRVVPATKGGIALEF